VKRTDRAVVGILGGLGPWATLDLFRRILELTPARRDQDHLHLIIENNPAVPERTAAIVADGDSPLPALVEGARSLAAAGADFIVMPCNTAHHWIEELAAAVEIPFIDMVAETVAATMALPENIRCVGLLATTGTIRSGVYARRFAERGIEAITPDEAAQRDLVMGAIFGPEGIKAGHLDEANRDRLAAAGRELIEAGAQALIAACTEIPLVLRPGDVPVPLVDTLDCLARATVKRASEGEVERWVR